MQPITSLTETESLIVENRMILLYLSRSDCGVCTALKPKVEAMLLDYPEILLRYIDLDLFPEAAGRFSIFTIPGILLYVDGHETVREARYISIDELEAAVSRPYGFIYDQ